MPYAIDLHTHSAASPDGSLSLEDYRTILQQGRLQCIAVTDHNTIEMAQQLQAALGECIIVGEEITTTEGEIIGLYLTETIPPMMTPTETVQAIEAQGGLVYIPHPFETVRKGVTAETLQTIANNVDIMEVHNGRAIFQNYSEHAMAWARTHNTPGAASSDAHGKAGWGLQHYCRAAHTGDIGWLIGPGRTTSRLRRYPWYYVSETKPSSKEVQRCLRIFYLRCGSFCLRGLPISCRFLLRTYLASKNFRLQLILVSHFVASAFLARTKHGGA